MSTVQSKPALHLTELLSAMAFRSSYHVPDWMMGLYRRHCIAFADGTSDTETQVFWLQSRNFSIDLRLPRRDQLLAVARAPEQYSKAELTVLGQYEGWVAESVWNGKQLVWRDPTALQLHDRWPEPAPLQRVGNCMIEFAPSGVYVEDWRLQPSRPGPLVGLRLVEEREVESGLLRHRGGGLIISGDYAGLVLGRAEGPGPEPQGPLLQHLLAAAGNAQELAKLLNFETSIGYGSIAKGFNVTHSTLPGRVGQPLFSLEGFSAGPDGTVHQQVKVNGKLVKRVFVADALEAEYAWPQATVQTEASKAWVDKEAATLKRYTRSLI